MTDFKINKQTEAQKDDYLLECFHDSGVIDNLIANAYSIISGRTGSGKTAIARYLEKNGADYKIDIAYRISVRNISLTRDKEEKDRLNSILLFIIVQTVKKLLKEETFDSKNEQFWKDFMVQNGLQDVLDYETFTESQKKSSSGFAIRGMVSNLVARVDGSHSRDSETASQRSIISNAPIHLFEQLKASVPGNLRIFIFVDDTSDYLDHTSSEELRTEINVIKELLFSLSDYNSSIKDSGKDLRFVTLFREDLFPVMEGSGINKLRSDSLKLIWNEKNFASLLIKRLPFFDGMLDQALKDPIASIKGQFPDSIFTETLERFETKRYQTNFYAYMIAVSFNRPRDFLNFCFAMRDRLSAKKPVAFENIDAAEIEYSNYFRQELQDELYLASRILDYEADQDHLNELIDILGGKEGFTSSEMRTRLGQYLGKKTSLGKKKIQFFIEELWRYGILGYMEKQDRIINFSYLSEDSTFSITKIKKYSFFLHRGLWWFTQKRKVMVSRQKDGTR